MRIAVIGLVVLALAPRHTVADQAPEAPRRILIVADDLTLQFIATPRVRDLMKRTVRLLQHDGDLVAMVSTGPSGVALPLSPDWNRLESGIRRVTGGGLSPQDVASTPLAPAVATELRDRAVSSSSTAAEALRSIQPDASSRAIVLYFGDGYPASMPEPKEFFDEASRANATIYAIDSRGLVTVPPSPQWDAYVSATQGSLRTLAARTHGSVITTVAELDALLSHMTRVLPTP